MNQACALSSQFLYTRPCEHCKTGVSNSGREYFDQALHIRLLKAQCERRQFQAVGRCAHLSTAQEKQASTSRREFSTGNQWSPPKTQPRSGGRGGSSHSSWLRTLSNHLTRLKARVRRPRAEFFVEAIHMPFTGDFCISKCHFPSQRVSC